MKKCSTCKIEKPLTDFGKDSSSKNGLKKRCRSCRSEKEVSSKEYKHQWYLKNKDQHLENHKKYVEKNENKIKFYKKQWVEDNKKRLSESAKKRYEVNKEEILTKQHKWHLLNKDKFKIKRQQTYKKYIESHKWIRAWRNTLSNSLKRLKLQKNDTTEHMLGYNYMALKSHLENLWLPGMSWDNYGDWHVDHIKPLFTFPCTTPTSVVNALSNLRPLWATTREINGIIYEGNLNRIKKL